MKKALTLLLILSFFVTNSKVFALETLKEESPVSTQNQNPQIVIHNDAPVWAEYVAPKYRNPRSDFSKGASMTELIFGIVLTDLVITAPIGIPMTVHGTTKVKMVSYNNRKNIFDNEIAKAQLIENDNERAEAYQKVLKRCHLKESTREHYAKKEAKAQKKALKKTIK